MLDKKQLYLDKMEAQLREWQARLAEARAKADAATADTKLEASRHVDRLQAEGETLKAKLGEVQAAGEEAWEEVRKGIDSAWEKMKAAIGSNKE